MKTLPEELIIKFKDGSIPKTAVTELRDKYQAQFNKKSRTRFFDILASSQPPTPDEYDFFVEQITKYWDFYNPGSVVSPSPKAKKKPSPVPQNKAHQEWMNWKAGKQHLNAKI